MAKAKRKNPRLRKKMSIGEGYGGVETINATMEGLTSFFDDVEELTKDVVQRAGMMIVSETDPLVPRDTQALAESWQVEVEETQRGGYKAIVAYGGISRIGETRNARGGIVHYAVRVHEDLEMFHPNGGEAKFLEKGAEKAKPRIVAEMVAELRDLARE